jgi:hypothetical protein
LHRLPVVKRKLLLLAVLSVSLTAFGAIGCDEGKDIGSGCRTADDCSDIDHVCEIVGDAGDACGDDDACGEGFCVEGQCADEPGTCTYLE